MGRKKPSHGTFHGTAVMCITPRYHPNCTKLFPAPVPLDAPITWDRSGGDYSCSPPLLKSDSAPLRTHRLSPAPGSLEQPPAMRTLFPRIYTKEYSGFCAFCQYVFYGMPSPSSPYGLDSSPRGRAFGRSGRSCWTRKFFASEAEVLRAYSNTSSFSRAMSRSIRATRLNGVIR